MAKQHESVYRSPDGVDEEEAYFGEGVALMALLLKEGHTSESAAFHVSREDYEQAGFRGMILKGGMRDNGEEFMFWVEPLPESPKVVN